MHSSNLVIVDKDAAQDGLESAVEEAMGPSEENGGFWDWYQIGGRWTGTFDGYEPGKDPNNREICSLCGGTGKRTDMEVVSGCNGCEGKGERAKWPTKWKFHPGDLLPVDKLTEELLEKFFRVVVHTKRFGNAVWGGEMYIPWNEGKETFMELPKPPLEWLQKEFSGCMAVVVDSHC